jgi:hypothetical protein
MAVPSPALLELFQIQAGGLDPGVERWIISAARARLRVYGPSFGPDHPVVGTWRTLHLDVVEG